MPSSSLSPSSSTSRATLSTKEVNIFSRLGAVLSLDVAMCHTFPTLPPYATPSESSCMSLRNQTPHPFSPALYGARYKTAIAKRTSPQRSENSSSSSSRNKERTQSSEVVPVTPFQTTTTRTGQLPFRRKKCSVFFQIFFLFTTYYTREKIVPLGKKGKKFSSFSTRGAI